MRRAPRAVRLGGVIDPRIIAHRGYAGRYPENTRASVLAAVEYGAAAVEIDVQLTRDGEVVLFHDRDLVRVCGAKGAIHQRSLAELGALRVREPERLAPFGPAVALVREPIATLADLATELAARRAPPRLFVEVKRVAVEAHGVERVCDAVLEAAAPLEGRFVIISFSLEVIERVRALGAVPIGPILEDFGAIDSKRARALSPEWTFCNRERLPEGADPGAFDTRLAVYEVVDPAEARALFERGVDAVETFELEALSRGLRALEAHS